MEIGMAVMEEATNLHVVIILIVTGIAREVTETEITEITEIKIPETEIRETEIRETAEGLPVLEMVVTSVELMNHLEEVSVIDSPQVIGILTEIRMVVMTSTAVDLGTTIEEEGEMTNMEPAVVITVVVEDIMDPQARTTVAAT